MNAQTHELPLITKYEQGEIMKHFKGWMLLVSVGTASLLVPLLGISAVVG